MGIDMRSTLVLNALNLLAGFIVLFTAIWYLIFSFSIFGLLAGVYIVFFAAVIIAQELVAPPQIYQYADFYRHWLGRGVAVVYLGIICTPGFSFSINTICGLLVIAIGAAFIAFHFMGFPMAGPVLKETGGGGYKFTPEYDGASGGAYDSIPTTSPPAYTPQGDTNQGFDAKQDYDNQSYDNTGAAGGGGGGGYDDLA
eukprot:TRINITY_DN5953_c0_g1_i1.p1 TRINITY_DN5953_c0_g1~~TRINITY_DN5953_c0_g1_i1.p1  ORF type:complete len:198 (-),score=66.60 TRINITY_DN5953_c0_g1_i1:171-764(-)